MRVLIVEDNPIIAMMQEEVIRGDGHEPVGPAADGATAIELAARDDLDLALIDYALEGVLTGVDVAEALAKAGDCHCVFITGNASLVREADTSARGLLEKPVRAPALIALLEAVDAERAGGEPSWPAAFEPIAEWPAKRVGPAWR